MWARLGCGGTQSLQYTDELVHMFPQAPVGPAVGSLPTGPVVSFCGLLRRRRRERASRGHFAQLEP